MDSQYCTEEHFKAALAIVETCLEHSRLLLTQLRHNESAPELSCPRKGRILLEKLPERFTLAEAYTIGEAEGMDKRLVRRLIYKLNPLFIKRISHGEYQKNKPVTPPKSVGKISRSNCPFPSAADFRKRKTLYLSPPKAIASTEKRYRVLPCGV